MFSRTRTMTYTESYSDKITRLRTVISESDAVLIGAGAGLSTAAGLTYSGERFYKYFSDFAAEFRIRDMYSGGFYPFPDLETYWGWWSRHIWYNRYAADTSDTYSALLKLVQDKDYFVITTNVDHQFQLSGFDKNRLFYTQGDYGLFQCSKGCHQKTYDNRFQIEQMMERQQGLKIPTELIPHCPVCDTPMTVNLRCDDTFVQDEGWYAASKRYDDFIRRHSNMRILYLELGVGGNTPIIIKYPFWKMTANNPQAMYACINLGESMCPREIEEKSICIDGDIRDVLEALR